MIPRRSALLLGLVLVLAACSTGESLFDADRAGGPLDSDEARPSTTLPSGPTTTFVPPLVGPFTSDGGAVFDAGRAEVIVESADDLRLPSALSGLAFPTDWTRRTVEDWNEFLPGLSGADPRDGIPPLDQPVFETVAAAAEWLGPREPGALVQLDGEARFYPLSILTRHEIVNDAFGGVPVAVTFCPLCNTALSFDRRVNGETLRFGVSGLLRNSDLVMWDDKTTSLWQQITGEGVVGDFAGAQLEIIPTSIVSFDQFAQTFPDGKSLAAESGFGRGTYGINPYSGYSASSRPFLFSGEIDDRFEALSRVVGVDTGDAIRAYPFDALQQRQVINDTIGDVPVAILWGGDTADALDQRVIGTSDAIGTALALDPVVGGVALTFVPGPTPGTFVDDQTGSTWTVLGQATDGELAGTQLDVVTHRNEFWFAWQAFFGPEEVYESAG